MEKSSIRIHSSSELNSTPLSKQFLTAVKNVEIARDSVHLNLVIKMIATVRHPIHVKSDAGKHHNALIKISSALKYMAI